MRVTARASVLLRRLAASATPARPAARSLALRSAGRAMQQAELRSETLQPGTERGWREFGTAAAGAGATGTSRDWVLHEWTLMTRGEEQHQHVQHEAEGRMMEGGARQHDLQAPESAAGAAQLEQGGWVASP